VKFEFVTTYGLPAEVFDMYIEDKGWEMDKKVVKAFLDMMESHRVLSRKGAEKKFGGIGIDQIKDEEDKKKATRLHTITHLLHQALRTLFGDHIRQMGSNITPERLRFDFSHHEKLSDKAKEKIEEMVNKKISNGFTVIKESMSFEDAMSSGALAFFKEKYPKEVSVYTIKSSNEDIISKEICVGPHIKSSEDLGIFKIIKEESSGAGIRRIKAKLL